MIQRFGILRALSTTFNNTLHVNIVNNALKTTINEPNKIITRNFAGLPKKRVVVAPEPIVIRNEQIKQLEMRVVFKDPITQENGWKMMTRQEALQIARKEGKDLILVNAKSIPIVCKLDNYVQIVRQIKEKVKDIKVNQKLRGLKEIYIGGGIDTHDLSTKLKKVIDFLEDGHSVKISVIAKKPALRTNPYCVEETIIKILESVEKHVASVQQATIFSASKKDFTLFPLVNIEEVKKKA